MLFPSRKILLSIVSDNRKNFRVVVLNKGTEKERIVFAPKLVTKTCQQFILDKYLSHLVPSEYVVSYQKHKSIIDVPKPHMENKYFLHLDIKHYFNRMSWNKFVVIVDENFPNSNLNKCLKNNLDAKFLKSILCFKDKIVQGSVTSPHISNLYLYDFDKFVGELIRTIPDGAYSRYSDDIYISSSRYINHSIIEDIKNKLSEYDLKLNYQKIKYTKLKNSIRITGLSLTTDRRLVLNTKFKKSLKKEIYQAIKNKGKGTNFNHLFGCIYYLKSVNPEYFSIIQRKYGKGDIVVTDILKDLRKNLESLSRDKTC